MFFVKFLGRSITWRTFLICCQIAKSLKAVRPHGVGALYPIGAIILNEGHSDELCRHMYPGLVNAKGQSYMWTYSATEMPILTDMAITCEDQRDEAYLTQHGEISWIGVWIMRCRRPRDRLVLQNIHRDLWGGRVRSVGLCVPWYLRIPVILVSMVPDCVRFTIRHAGNLIIKPLILSLLIWATTDQNIQVLLDYIELYELDSAGNGSPVPLRALKNTLGVMWQERDPVQDYKVCTYHSKLNIFRYNLFVGYRSHTEL